MREINNPTPVRRGSPPGPVVIWNLIRRCNLNCKHCYSISADTDFAGELSTDEIFTVMTDLRGFGVPVLIPENYVPDLDVRLGLYRRLSGLHEKVELEGFAAELIDRFGKLPKEVNTLLNIVRVKSMCKRAGIARLDGGPKGATIQFHNDKFANPAGLVTFLQDQRGMAKVRDNKIVVRRDWKKTGDKMKGAFAIARDLAQLAKAGAKA